MRVTGTATVAAPPPQVWQALQDPAVLVRTIPGCSRLETIATDTYAMTISAGVASIKGTYAGEVALAEPDPPNSFVLRAKGQGAPGTVDATVRVHLSPDSESGTRIDYDADAVVGGMIGGVGQRMLATVAKRTAGEFFTAVERALTQPEQPAAGVRPEAAEQAVRPTGAAEPVRPSGAAEPERQVFLAPQQQRPSRPEPGVAWAMTAAFSAGGIVALAGVALGYALGRRATR